MLIPTDPSQASALDDSIRSNSREVYAVVRFDWNRDGNFSHTYSDLSDLASEVTVDRSYQSTLPEGLNVVSGFSSGALSLLLGGSRVPGEAAASKLFDLYDGSSPLAGITIIGTPVEVRFRERTVLGDVDTRAFVGNVRGFRLHKLTGEVEVSAIDNYDMIGTDVTLPRWGVASTNPTGAMGDTKPAGVLINTNPFFSWLPQSSRWVAGELTRQMGRGQTRPVRAEGDTLSYHTLVGGTLPSVGNIADMYSLSEWIDRDGLVGVGWQNSYYPAFQSLTGYPIPRQYRTVCSAVQPITLPLNSVGQDQPREIGCVFNIQNRVNTSSTANRFETRFYVEDWRSLAFYLTAFEDPDAASGYCSVVVKDNGQIVLTIRDNYATSEGFGHAWIFTSAVGAVPYNPDVWQELWCKFVFTVSGNAVTVYVNGSPVTMTRSGSANARLSPRAIVDTNNTALGLNGGFVRNGRTNVVLHQSTADEANGRYANVIGVEWFGGQPNVTLNYSSQSAIPTRQNGSANVKYWAAESDPVAPTVMKGWIHNLPETVNAMGWDRLSEVIGAECGTMWVDENGTLNIADVSWQVPPLPSDPANYLTITDDKLSDLVIDPTDDNRRNKIIFNASFKGTTGGFIYEMQDARGKLVTASNESANQGILHFSNGNAVRINTYMQLDQFDPSIDNPATDGYGNRMFRRDDVRSGHVTVANTPFGDDVPKDSGGGLATPNYSAYIVGDGRIWGDSVSLSTGNLSTKVSSYIGGMKALGQACLRISGMVEGEEQQLQVTDQNDASIAAYGRRTLSLDTTPWRQSRITGKAVNTYLLQTLVNPAPQVENLVTPADQRRQIWDVLYVNTGTNLDQSGKFFSQVLKKTTRWTKDEFTDTLGLRVLGNPGSGNWDSGIWDASTWV